jgi:glycosyltransferase involved in cell wall biosynthesis
VRKSPPNEPHLAFAVPGDLATRTGGYGYDRRIIQELRELGWQVDVADIGDDFPLPSNAERATALAILSAVPAGCPIVLDGLAFGALPEAGALRCRTPLIALVHQPRALDPGLDTTQADTFRETERAALAAAARVVVTSEATARIVMADYDVPSQRISVVRPGNDPVPPAPGSNGGVVSLLSVGSVVPVKRYDLLIAAVATLTDSSVTYLATGSSSLSSPLRTACASSVASNTLRSEARLNSVSIVIRRLLAGSAQP